MTAVARPSATAPTHSSNVCRSQVHSRRQNIVLPRKVICARQEDRSRYASLMTGIGRPLATNKASGRAVVRGTALERTIRAKLEEATGADVLEVLNESRMHNVPPEAETHFRVVVVSSRFEGATRLRRHRVVHRALAEELAGPIHALAIDAFTPAEWRERSEKRSLSPDCRGGGQFDAAG